jgi:hypothetical protein
VSDRMDETTHLRPSPSVYARAFGDEIVLLDCGRGEYFGLDEIGALVWSRIEAGDPLGAIADRIVERYDVTRDVALRDLMELVQDLLRSTLVAPS